MQRPNWRHNVFFGLHFDLHANEHDTELGAETTYTHIRAELAKVGPDWVQYDCKGHPGYTSYPTQVGVASPGIVKDALKIWSKVAHDMGIPIVVHYSGTWDQAQWKLHPEWARRRADGTLCGGEGWNPHALAANSPYAEQLLIPQLQEVIDRYDIDGVWVDGECWAAAPDWSDWTVKPFVEHVKANGLSDKPDYCEADVPRAPDDPLWAEYMAFNRRQFEAYLTRYAEALHAHKPAFTVCSNWAYTARMPDDVSAPVDYLSGDFIWAFGLDSAVLEGKFMDSRGLPWDLMAWGFTTAGSMHKARWTTKSPAILKVEGALVAANGGAYQIYDTPLRNGRLVDWHMDVFAEVGRFMRERQAVCQGSTSARHVALLHSQSSFYANNHPEGTTSIYNEGQPARTLTGALALLLDNHYHADVMNETTLRARLSDARAQAGDGYKVVVVAEQTNLPAELKQELIAWVKQGGRLLLTGSHIAADFGEKTLGVRAEGDPKDEVVFVPADGGAVNVGGVWLRVKTAGARSLAPLLRSQELKRGATGNPAATLRKLGKGYIAAIYGPVATVYADYRYPRIRSFAGEVLRALTGPMPVEIDAPHWVQLTVREKPGQTIAHLVNTGSSNPLSPVNPYVEDVPAVGPLTVRVQCDRRPAAVTLEPDHEGLAWTWSRGVLTATIDALYIHSALVVDFGRPTRAIDAPAAQLPQRASLPKTPRKTRA